MKNAIIYLSIMCCWLPFWASGQGSRPAIFLVDSVPLVIFCESYIDTLKAGEENNDTLYILSDKVKVATMAAVNGVTVTRMFRTGIKLLPKDLERVEYRSLSQGSKQEWKPLPPTTDTGDTSRLSEATLSHNGQLRMEFRYTDSKQPVQSITFLKADIRPLISASRIRNDSDSTDDQLEAMAVRGREGIPQGFGSPTMDNLILQPSTHLELIMDRQWTSTDSSILYRVLENNGAKNPAWIRSGHFFKLKSMRPGKEYILESRYDGMDAVFRLAFTVLPYWYQTPTAITLFIMVALALLLLARTLLYRHRLLQEQRSGRQAKDRLAMLQNKLNPHFVSNALSSIQELMNNDKIESANRYLNRFSTMMRGTLYNSGKFLIPLTEEIDMLRNYLSMEQSRFGFGFDIRLDERLEADRLALPPMLLQPTAENAVNHG